LYIEANSIGATAGSIERQNFWAQSDINLGEIRMLYIKGHKLFCTEYSIEVHILGFDGCSI